MDLRWRKWAAPINEMGAEAQGYNIYPPAVLYYPRQNQRISISSESFIAFVSFIRRNADFRDGLLIGIRLRDIIPSSSHYGRSLWEPRNFSTVMIYRSHL